MGRLLERGVWIRMLGLLSVLAMFPSSAIAGSCSQVLLKDASGVIGMAHGYTFSAVCSWSYQESKDSFSLSGFSSTSTNYGIDMEVVGKGKWDRKTGQAKEAVSVKGYGWVKGPSGSFTGERVATGVCNQDPFLKDPPGATAVCQAMNVQYEGTSGPIFPVFVTPKRFLLEKKISLVEAQALSAKKSAGAPPPPPPAPKPQKPPKLKAGTLSGSSVAQPKAGLSPVLPAAKPKVGIPSGQAVATGVGAPVGPPDITTEGKVIVAGKASAWRGMIVVDAKDATRVSGGQCEFPVKYTVRNAGLSSTGQFGSLWQNNPPTGSFGRSWLPLAPGGASTQTDLVMLKPGLNVLRLTLDNLNQVSESNEGNNAFPLTVNVTGSCGSGPVVRGGATVPSRGGIPPPAPPPLRTLPAPPIRGR